MQYKITVCYKMEDLLYIYAYTDIQLRIDCRCLVVGFLYSSGGLQGSNNIVVFLTICISYTNNCFTL